MGEFGAEEAVSSLTRSQTVIELQQLPTEIQGNTIDMKKIVLDFLCRTKDGRLINVEMQRAEQKHIADRCLYHFSRIVSEHVGYKGKNKDEKAWGWYINPVYVIAIFNFDLSRIEGISSTPVKNCWFAELGLAPNPARCKPVVEDKFTAVNEKLKIFLLSLSKFSETVERQNVAVWNELEKLAWILSELNTVEFEDELPAWSHDEPFVGIINDMQLRVLSESEKLEYQAEENAIRALEEVTNTKLEQGIEIGVEKGIAIGVENTRKNKCEALFKSNEPDLALKVAKTIYTIVELKAWGKME
ncbi:hypothetical protein MP638_004758 [Amoeboaphelidium occidentale]|nr:hypothetical protein MP638_004758 [Amoeboaphelidium occidentale]